MYTFDREEFTVWFIYFSQERMYLNIEKNLDIWWYVYFCYRKESEKKQQGGMYTCLTCRYVYDV